MKLYRTVLQLGAEELVLSFELLKLAIAFVLEQLDLILVLDLLMSQLLLHDIYLSLQVVVVLLLLIFTASNILSLVLQILDLLIHNL